MCSSPVASSGTASQASFQSGDAIDLPGGGYSLDHVGNTITLSNGRGIGGTLTLTGQDYTKGSGEQRNVKSM